MIAVTDESDKLAAPLIGAFRQTLHDAGYSEGRNIQIDIQYLAGRLERYPEVLTDTIQRGVDVIVVWAPTGAFAAKRATTAIPIVFLAVPNPVENGLVASFTHPGGNITGISWTASPEDLAKCLQLLRETAPKTMKVAAISSRADPIAFDTARRLEAAAGVMKTQIDTHWVENREDLDRELAVIRRNRPDGLLVAASTVTYIHRKLIADFAQDMRLPSVHQFREAVMDGALLSFGPSLKDVAERGAAYAIKILKGTKPGDLPVEQPRRYEILINLKTAKALGLTIPPSLLARADQVIE